MDNGDVQALVSAYEDGLYSFQEVAAKLLDWMDAHGLDRLVADLPEPLRHRLVRHLRKLYGNALPPEAFVSVRGEGAMTEEKLTAIRAWLAGQM